jgi:hypothetical protein
MGRNFVQGNKNKGALGKARVRNFESRFAEHKIAVENEIEIESTRAVGDGVEAVAAEFLLDGEKCAEKLERGERRFKRESGVEEARLIGEADGRGGVERRAGCDAAERGEAREGGGKGCIGGAGGAGNVRAEGDVGERHV